MFTQNELQFDMVVFGVNCLLFYNLDPETNELIKIDPTVRAALSTSAQCTITVECGA